MSPDPTRLPRTRPAFTLIEATLAMAVTSILLIGMGAALAASVRAVDRGSDPNAKAQSAARLAQIVADDAAIATSIEKISASELVLTVPSRDGSGTPEIIRYTADNAGQLLRSFDNGTSGVVGSNLTSLLFSNSTRAGSDFAGSEQVLASFTGSVSASNQSASIRSGQGASIYIRPTMPSGATSWSITRVQVRLTQGSGGTLRVSIMRPTSTLQPDGTALWSTTIVSTALPVANDWVTFLVAGVEGLSPTLGICVVLDAVTGRPCSLDYQDGSGLPFNTALLLQSGGTYAQASDSKDARFFLYGRINISPN